jgi:hypothetical protein
MHKGGISEPDMKALAVMPRTSSTESAVITVMPVVKLPMTRRNNATSIGDLTSLVAIVFLSAAICLFVFIYAAAGTGTTAAILDGAIAANHKIG